MSAPTIRDVAARAGVSKSSVSRVLSGSPLVSETSREAVQQAIDDLGYRPNAAARTLVRRRSNVVGVLVPDLRNPFLPEILDGLQAVAEDNGYACVVMSAKGLVRAEEAALQTLVEMQVDAIVCLTAPLMADALLEAATTVPIVSLTRMPELPAIDSVVGHDSLGAAVVVNHLVELGHRKIAMIANEEGRAGSDRVRGYLDAMRDAGLADEAQVRPGGFTELGGYTSAKLLLESEAGVTAIFAANDLGALGVLEAALEVGLDVPRDLSVVGYDNTATAALRRIGLTTVDQSATTIGGRAMEAALEADSDAGQSS